MPTGWNHVIHEERSFTDKCIKEIEIEAQFVFSPCICFLLQSLFRVSRKKLASDLVKGDDTVQFRVLFALLSKLNIISLPFRQLHANRVCLMHFLNRFEFWVFDTKSIVRVHEVSGFFWVEI
jgi:hypothetical protein